jgi:hypothetical protein
MIANTIAVSAYSMSKKYHQKYHQICLAGPDPQWAYLDEYGE